MGLKTSCEGREKTTNSILRLDSKKPQQEKEAERPLDESQ